MEIIKNSDNSFSMIFENSAEKLNFRQNISAILLKLLEKDFNENVETVSDMGDLFNRCVNQSDNSLDINDVIKLTNCILVVLSDAGSQLKLSEKQNSEATLDSELMSVIDCANKVKASIDDYAVTIHRQDTKIKELYAIIDAVS